VQLETDDMQHLRHEAELSCKRVAASIITAKLGITHFTSLFASLVASCKTNCDETAFRWLIPPLPAFRDQSRGCSIRKQRTSPLPSRRNRWTEAAGGLLEGRLAREPDTLHKEEASARTAT